MIRLKDVEKCYANGAKAINGISLEIEDGEFVFLVGPSGSGKSTIIKMLTGEIGPTAGRIMINGYNMTNISSRQVPYMRRTIGVIFQDFRLLEKKNVYENVLELVGLENKTRRLPGELSGGEQQRVAIARALVNNPETIIADEPTGNLDPERSFEIMSLLERINDLGTTMLVVTHEKDLVNRFSKRVIALEKGQIVSDHRGAYYDTSKGTALS